jgi:hypothetical protein
MHIMKGREARGKSASPKLLDDGGNSTQQRHPAGNCKAKYTGSTSACVIPDTVFHCYHLRKFETMLGRGILPNVN